MRILLADIETAPNTAFVWGMLDQNISHDQVKETSYILCWSAKWLGEPRTLHASVQHTPPLKMLKQIHSLLAQTDVLVTYNGGKFDVPVLNKEFVKAGLAPPSPYQQVDLYRIVRRVFRFESNKLDSVCRVLGLGKKTKHRGFSLWVGCMEGNAECWAEMEKYNRNDVAILEKLYNRLLPWMPVRPHAGVIAGKFDACPACGVAGRLQKRGVMTARTALYQRFQCAACGAWSRSRTKQKGVEPQYV